MNFRKHAEPKVLGFLIAPMVDILLVVLVFFIVTWNFALSENELDVRVPTASKANETQPYVGQVVINIAANGNVIVNRQQKSSQELLELLKSFPNFIQTKLSLCGVIKPSTTSISSMSLIFAARQTSGTLLSQRVKPTNEIASLANPHLQHLFCFQPTEPGSSTRPSDRADDAHAPAGSAGPSDSAHPPAAAGSARPSGNASPGSPRPAGLS